MKQSQGKETGDWWWNVSLNGQRIEVVASNKQEAWQDALRHNREWGNYSINDAKIEMLRPFKDNRPAPGAVSASVGAPQPIGRQAQPQTQPQTMTFEIFAQHTGEVLERFNVDNFDAATDFLDRYRDANPNVSRGLIRLRRVE